LFQPSQKLIAKQRHGSKVKKQYDPAKTPLQRAIEAGVLSLEQAEKYKAMAAALNPLALHKQLETLVRHDPVQATQADTSKKKQRKKGTVAAN